jgi:hypothetical protein
MDKRLDISAAMVLSINGEDFHLNASKDAIEITTPSFGSGLRTLLEIDKHHSILRLGDTVHDVLRSQGWTLYAHSGKFRLAIMGLNGRRGWMVALIYFGRLCRLAGAV